MTSGPVSASEAGYYECSYGEYAGDGGIRRIVPRVLKFMLNARLKKAFRIDTRVARKVEILVSRGGVISLLDREEGASIALISIQPDGRSVYSLHRLGGQRNGAAPPESVAEIGTQWYGMCRQFSDYAAWGSGRGQG